MTFAVVRVRGTLRVKPDIKETLRLLRLNKVNHCIVIPESPEYRGMLLKAKDYITWGEVDAETMTSLLKGWIYVKSKTGTSREFALTIVSVHVKLYPHPTQKESY